jgi:hypothetical protein
MVHVMNTPDRGVRVAVAGQHIDQERTWWRRRL